VGGIPQADRCCVMDAVLASEADVEIRARRLRAVKLSRKTLILRADAEAGAASLPELRTVSREQASAVTAK
jgi:hypothetical protein